jgi:hypothetical protein
LFRKCDVLDVFLDIKTDLELFLLYPSGPLSFSIPKSYLFKNFATGIKAVKAVEVFRALWDKVQAKNSKDIEE